MYMYMYMHMYLQCDTLPVLDIISYCVQWIGWTIISPHSQHINTSYQLTVCIRYKTRPPATPTHPLEVNSLVDTQASGSLMCL